MLTVQKRQFFEQYLVKEDRLLKLIKVSLPYLELIPETFDFVDFIGLVYSAPYRYLAELKPIFSSEWFKEKVAKLELLPYKGKVLRANVSGVIVGYPIDSFAHYSAKLLLGFDKPQELDIEDFKTVSSKEYVKISKRLNYKFNISNDYRFKHKRQSF